jgi:predicted ester cyclase
MAAAISPTPAGDFEGPAGFERCAAEAWRAFPDATFTIVEHGATNDQVWLRWTMTGRHLDRFGDNPATGGNVRIEGLAMFRFER